MTVKETAEDIVPRTVCVPKKSKLVTEKSAVRQGASPQSMAVALYPYDLRLLGQFVELYGEQVVW